MVHRGTSKNEWADAITSHWHPTTVAAARSIPLDISRRIKLCIEGFANRYIGVPGPRLPVNRRVQQAADHVNLGISRLYV